MRLTKKVILPIVILSSITIGIITAFTSATANQGAKVTVTETQGTVQQKKAYREKEKAEKVQEKAKEKALHAQKKKEEKINKTKIVNKKMSPDKKSSIATLKIGAQENESQLMKALDEKKVKVVHFENAIEVEGETIYAGLNSKNKLSNNQNLFILNNMTKQKSEKEFKGKNVQTRLNTITIIGSSEGVNNLEKEVNQ
ncbi:hypothetical protein M3699_22560 [Peribacillus simplex]|uniref:hypothetical protein n=1 Tax=Peribacillus simplex TaxID=1478 RepID=UPI00203F398D|nr:hypothetical protein [Peribacillus simplex]MCM3676555.1 hypothetical protein [Peribacillus simplex]